MRKSIAAIHVAKKELGLDDDTYRAALLQVTGKASSSDMTEKERQTVLEHFRSKGFKASSTGRRKPLEGRFAPKLQALWIAGWNLGLVRDRDDRALIAFVKRQTGIDHVRFLRHGQDAVKAIEGLKGWLERSGGVDWDEHKDPADCVLAAQMRRLKAAPSDVGFSIQANKEATPETVLAVTDIAKTALMNLLGEKIRALPGGAK
ncbi:MAG: regulatory protein GemA [Devosia sp.]|nr:regulatory protein GemA [Devosia sp.]MBN9333882.1 regulatory protein GemA [Devosia sp.]